LADLAAVLFILGHGLPDQRPKRGAVVKVPKVAEFMDHDVRLQVRGQKDNTIVKVEVAQGRAAPPP